jgi:hypothetical protein
MPQLDLLQYAPQDADLDVDRAVPRAVRFTIELIQK